MDQNPYEVSPTLGADYPEHDFHRFVPRPVGVTILAVLHFLSGILMIGALGYALTQMSAIDQGLRMVGIPPIIMLLSVVTLAVLTLASAVGMWLGTEWGWWCAAFYYVFSVFRNISALFMIATMTDLIEESDKSIEFLYFKHGFRIVIHFLLFLYFFKANILEYFHLEHLNKPKAIAKLAGVCASISVANFFIGLLPL